MLAIFACDQQQKLDRSNVWRRDNLGIHMQIANISWGTEHVIMC